MFCSIMKFIRTTWKSTYTEEHQFVFRPISFHATDSLVEFLAIPSLLEQLHLKAKQ